MLSRLRHFLARLANVLRPGRSEPDLAREVAAHLAMLEDDFARRGLPPDEARVAARRAFGGVEQTKDRHRDARSFVWLDDARRDVQYAARLLRRDPLFTLTAALSLALGIGANTTVFTVANALLFRAPAGVAEPERLVDIGSSRNRAGFGTVSYPNYLDLRDRATTLAGVYAQSLFPRAMSFGERGNAVDGERVYSTAVTANYFNVLGTAPAAGRLFGAGDGEQPGASPTVVLSHRFWVRRFDANPAVVGESVTLNGHPFTVIGVASEGFHGTGVRAGDVWIPMSVNADLTAQDAAALMNRSSTSLLVGARLKPGVSIAQAAAEADAIGLALAREYPDQNRVTGLRVQASSPVPGAAVPIAVFLMLITALPLVVLIVACANLAGVLLARAAARRREIAVRLAMGASRGRLVRQMLAETLMLCVLGGAGGLVLARVLVSVIIALLPALPFPVDVSLALDGRAIAFTTGLVLVAALLAPALQGSKGDAAMALKDDGDTLASLRLRHAFVIAQIALSILLVVVAGLFVRALQAVGSSNPGFELHGVELASLDLSMAGYTAATGPRFTRMLLDRVRTLPDVQRATIATVLPGGFETQRRAVTVPGVSPPAGQRFFDVDWNVVDAGYFGTLRIPMMAGRDFTSADGDGTAPVAIVGDGTARQFWPGEDAVGKYIVQPQFGSGGRISNEAKTLRIIGVVHDVKSTSLIDGFSRSLVYVPLQQQYTPAITIVARSTRGQRVADEIRAAVAAVDPNLPIITSQTLEESTALGLTPQRVVVSVSGSLGFVGLLLAAIGIYGVTAYAVTRRTREIGIRMALGARRADVAGMILRRGMSLATIGSLIGLLLAAGASRVLVVFLFGTSPFEPAIFGGAAALFAVVAFAACYAPARRATMVDPLVALRHE